ncbi:MAG: hypothetical protein WHU10_07605 [Fimbriimonadales bacterium]
MAKIAFYFAVACVAMMVALAGCGGGGGGGGSSPFQGAWLGSFTDEGRQTGELNVLSLTVSGSGTVSGEVRLAASEAGGAGVARVSGTMGRDGSLALKVDEGGTTKRLAGRVTRSSQTRLRLEVHPVENPSETQQLDLYRRRSDSLAGPWEGIVALSESLPLRSEHGVRAGVLEAELQTGPSRTVSVTFWLSTGDEGRIVGWSNDGAVLAGTYSLSGERLSGQFDLQVIEDGTRQSSQGTLLLVGGGGATEFEGHWLGSFVDGDNQLNVLMLSISGSGVFSGTGRDPAEADEQEDLAQVSGAIASDGSVSLLLRGKEGVQRFEGTVQRQSGSRLRVQIHLVEDPSFALSFDLFRRRTDSVSGPLRGLVMLPGQALRFESTGGVLSGVMVGTVEAGPGETPQVTVWLSTDADGKMVGWSQDGRVLEGTFALSQSRLEGEFDLQFYDDVSGQLQTVRATIELARE